MTGSRFRELLTQALDCAAEQAEARLGSRIPRSFLIELHSPRSPGRRVGSDEALDQFYLGADRCYRIIDTAITQVTPDMSVAFMRVSGHQPAGFDQTWDPLALGPFKQMHAEHVEDQRVHSG
ncbi:MAG TPA: hypothetical protein VGI78_23665 [Acetobacteraceae bacterium]|jgi:hypothetical protein